MYISIKMNSKKNFLVVSHDPGGAEYLSSYLLNKNINFAAILEGPAKNIFFKKFRKKVKLRKNTKNVFKNIDQVITSTSWTSNLEKKIISKAKKNNIKVTSILDHWTNYRERFVYKKKNLIPETILVMDKYAEKLAKNEFPLVKIQKTKNYYLNDSIKLIKKNFRIKKDFHLYLSEPIKNFNLSKSNRKKFDYNEFDALRYFLNNFEKIYKTSKPICFRLHPSENKKKYLKILREENKNLNIFFSKGKNLEDDIARASTVFGCETMAMVLATMLKKKVISVIPKFSKQICRLPFKKISYLRDLVN